MTDRRPKDDDPKRRDDAATRIEPCRWDAATRVRVPSVHAVLSRVLELNKDVARVLEAQGDPITPVVIPAPLTAKPIDATARIPRPGRLAFAAGPKNEPLEVAVPVTHVPITPHLHRLPKTPLTWAVVMMILGAFGLGTLVGALGRELAAPFEYAQPPPPPPPAMPMAPGRIVD